MKKIFYSIFVSALVLVSACSQEGSKQYIPPVQEKIDVGDETIAEDPTPKVDILFVVDSSGSMQEHQAKLAINIPEFTAAFTKNSQLDYHIGVVTTDMSSSLHAGRLVGAVKIVNRRTPNADQILAGNLKVGVNGSGTEKSYAPVLAALKKPLVDNQNKGFYRPGAHLVIVFITDAEDQSGMNENVFWKELLALKGNDPSKILAYGVLTASFDLNCKAVSETRPLNIERFLALAFKGTPNVMSLCSPTYGAELASMGTDISTRVGNVIYLKRLPVKGSIRVKLGNTELPSDPVTGWIYDAEKNAIILGEGINWSSFPDGAELKVSYEAMKTVK